jgi:hypothetical protein
LDSEPSEKLYVKKHQTLEAGRSYRQIEFPPHSTPKTPSKKIISINDFEVG